jgi:hypothetical protein
MREVVARSRVKFGETDIVRVGVGEFGQGGMTVT